LLLSGLFSLGAETIPGETGKEFSREEKLWAVRWINEKLSLLMEDGLIKRIECSGDDSRYEVFVTSAWELLSTEEKKNFLNNLSRAREITRHSPFLVVKCSESGEILAQVSRWGVVVFGQEGEFFTEEKPEVYREGVQ
jgi:hypothetical protein